MLKDIDFVLMIYMYFDHVVGLIDQVGYVIFENVIYVV